VYEFARSFRNEGVDASHLPDFTLLEYYAAYWNYEDNMNFTEKLLKHLLTEIKGCLEIEYDGRKINFDGVWERVSFRDLILRDCGIDIYECDTKQKVLAKIKEKEITLDTSADIKKSGTRHTHRFALQKSEPSANRQSDVHNKAPYRFVAFSASK